MVGDKQQQRQEGHYEHVKRNERSKDILPKKFSLLSNSDVKNTKKGSAQNVRLCAWGKEAATRGGEKKKRLRWGDGGATTKRKAAGGGDVLGMETSLGPVPMY